MRRHALSMVMLITACLATAAPAAAPEVAHPADVHEGACPAPGAIVAPLGDVTTNCNHGRIPATDPLPVGADVPRHPVIASVTTLDMPLATLVSTDHSIVVHASTEEMGTYLACGSIGGRTIVSSPPDRSRPSRSIGLQRYRGARWRRARYHPRRRLSGRGRDAHARSVGGTGGIGDA